METLNVKRTAHQDLMKRVPLKNSRCIGPRGSILPLGVVMIIVGRPLSKTLFFSCVSWLKYCPRSYNLFYVDMIIYF